MYTYTRRMKKPRTEIGKSILLGLAFWGILLIVYCLVGARTVAEPPADSLAVHIASNNHEAVEVEQVEADTPHSVTPPPMTEKSTAVIFHEQFGEDYKKALAIAWHESRIESVESHVDVTADGRAFSAGIMQINMSVHPIDGLDCPSAFHGTNYTAVVVDEDLYQRCLASAMDEEKNIKKAKEIYDRQGWRAWLYSARKVGIIN